MAKLVTIFLIYFPKTVFFEAKKNKYAFLELSVIFFQSDTDLTTKISALGTYPSEKN